ncbi:MAG: 50S ribosomal protein L5, partial [Chloroflexi bacterium]|nr:50S ribosomal protein L5 [Chloroflexota bacterium]
MKTNGTASAPRLKQRFNDEIAPRLFEEFSFENVMQVPRVVKVVVNSGVGESLGPGGAAILENCVADMTTICGQKPVVNKAKKSIANFKLREGNNVGVSCTLRG